MNHGTSVAVILTILRKILVKDFTCQLELEFKLRCWCHGKLEILLIRGTNKGTLDIIVPMGNLVVEK